MRVRSLGGGAGDPVGQQGLERRAGLGGFLVGQQRIEVSDGQRLQPRPQLGQREIVVVELDRDVRRFRRRGVVSLLRGGFGRRFGGSAEYNANRPSVRRSRSSANCVTGKVSSRSSSNVAHSGCSSLGGNNASSVSSPLITSSAMFCWNRMKMWAAWLTSVIGYISSVCGNLRVSSTIVAAAPISNRTPYGALAMGTSLPY